MEQENTEPPSSSSSSYFASNKKVWNNSNQLKSFLTCLIKSLKIKVRHSTKNSSSSSSSCQLCGNSEELISAEISLFRLAVQSVTPNLFLDFDLDDKNEHDKQSSFLCCHLCFDTSSKLMGLYTQFREVLELLNQTRAELMRFVLIPYVKKVKKVDKKLPHDLLDTVMKYWCERVGVVDGKDGGHEVSFSGCQKYHDNDNVEVKIEEEDENTDIIMDNLEFEDVEEFIINPELNERAEFDHNSHGEEEQENQMDQTTTGLDVDVHIDSPPHDYENENNEDNDATTVLIRKSSRSSVLSNLTKHRKMSSDSEEEEERSDDHYDNNGSSSGSLYQEGSNTEADDDVSVVSEDESSNFEEDQKLMSTKLVSATATGQPERVKRKYVRRKPLKPKQPKKPPQIKIKKIEIEPTKDKPKTKRIRKPEKKAQCSVCKRWLKSSYHRNIHLRIHTNEKPFMCSSCPKAFYKSSNLFAHVRAVHEKNPKHKCPQCDKKFTEKYLMKNHLAIVHNIFDPSRPTFPCLVCHRIFPFESYLKMHLSRCTHIRKDILKTKCDTCDLDFASINELIAHKQTQEHKEKQRLVDVEKRRLGYEKKKRKQQSTSTPTSFYAPTSTKRKCRDPECKEEFENTSQMLKHYTKAHVRSKEKQHMCEICGKSFYNKGALSKHFRTHNEEPRFVCKVLGCTAKFHDKQSLQVHTTKHTKEFLLKCSHCEEGFNIVNSLRKHLAQSHPEKISPFVCNPVCWIAFETQEQLDEHMKGHEATYRCHVCFKWFASGQRKKIHLLIHTGEKPFVCDFPGCKSKFNNFENLTEHRFRHTDDRPYCCTVCKRGFLRKKALLDHNIKDGCGDETTNDSSGRKRGRLNKLLSSNLELNEPNDNSSSNSNTSTCTTTFINRNPTTSISSYHYLENSTQQQQSSSSSTSTTTFYFQPYNNVPIIPTTKY